MAQHLPIDELRRRVELNPASIAFAALAEEYRRVGRIQDAITVCRDGLKRHPSYVSAHVTLGRALFEAGETDAARQEFEGVLRVAPENLAAIRGLAEIQSPRVPDPRLQALTTFLSAIEQARRPLQAGR